MYKVLHTKGVRTGREAAYLYNRGGALPPIAIKTRRVGTYYKGRLRVLQYCVQQGWRPPRTTRVEWQSPKENIIPAKHSSLDGFPFPFPFPTTQPPIAGVYDERGWPSKKRVAKPEGDNTKPFRLGNALYLYIYSATLFINERLSSP